MAVTGYPLAGDSPHLTLLNVARLFTRLEHKLLSPGSELRTLRRSEFQRMRVTKVSSFLFQFRAEFFIEYMQSTQD